MDPLTIGAIAAGSQALGGIVQGIVGAGQKRQAKRIMKSNPRPVYKMAKPIKDNQAIAETEASRGMSDESKQVYKQEAERGVTSGIDAIIKGGGSVNNIADLYGNLNTGVSKMALLDEEFRARNVRSLIDQNNAMAGELDKEWQVNVWGPYADKAQAAATLQKQGSENQMKGLNTVMSAGANFATSQMYGQEGANVFGPADHANRTMSGPPPALTMDDYRASRSNYGASVRNRFPGLTGGFPR